MSGTAAATPGVDVKYVNPFLESVYELFEKMLQSTATRGKLNISDGKLSPRTVTGMIGLSGGVRGTVTICLPTETALAIVNTLLGTDTRIVDDTVADGVMEVVNIIAGGAKARFPQASDKPVSLSLPTVVRGGDFHVDYPSSSVWLEVPFTSGLGAFTLRVTFEGRQTVEGTEV